MKSTLITLLLVYIACCVMLYLGQRSFLYFPTSVNKLIKQTKVEFNNHGITLNGWVVNPNQERALIYYGGNAEAIELNIPFFQAELPNVTVYLIPYRGYAGNMGQPSEQAFYSDALHIFDKIGEEHASISLMGRSLGSGIANYVAANREIEKLILITPFDSIESIGKNTYWMFPISLMLIDKYKAIDYVDNIRSTPLILIAENDQVIKRRYSENLANAFTSPQTVIIKGADHNDISFYSQFAESIVQFMQNPSN